MNKYSVVYRSEEHDFITDVSIISALSYADAREQARETLCEGEYIEFVELISKGEKVYG